jgi:hypothetical protein
MSDLQSAVSEAESILDDGRSVRPIWAPDYFFGVFTCFGFRFSRPRLSLLTPAVCHESLNLPERFQVRARISGTIPSSRHRCNLNPVLRLDKRLHG